MVHALVDSSMQCTQKEFLESDSRKVVNGDSPIVTDQTLANVQYSRLLYMYFWISGALNE